MRISWRAAAVVALLAMVLFTASLAITMRSRVQRRMATVPLPMHLNDFDHWMNLAPGFLRDHADYANDGFPYPPTMWILMFPLTRLPIPDAHAVWICTKPLMAIAILLLSLDMFRRAGKSIEPAWLALVLAAWIWPIINDMQQGQVNLLVLLILTAGLWLAQREMPRDELLGGLLLALAVALKVTPLAFLPYFFWRRRWRVSAAFALGIPFWLFVVPALAFGWHQNLRWLDQWSKIMIFPYINHGNVLYDATQSLPSALARFLTNTPALAYTKNGVPHGIYVNILSLPMRTVGWITRITLLAIGAAGLMWMRHPLRTLQSERYVLESGAVLAFMLWASERTWVHHYVLILLPALGAGMLAGDRSRSRRVRRWSIGALIFLLVAMLSATDFAKIFAGMRGSEYARILGLYLIASLFLTATIVCATWQPDIRSKESPAHSD